MDEQLNKLVKGIFTTSRETYGTRRLKEVLVQGDCWDNFVSSLKTELIYHEDSKTKAQANEMIFEYIEIFYNRKRLIRI